MYPGGEGREQQERHQVQGQRQEAGETEEGLPAHRVTGVMETLIVESHVTQHVHGDHQPQDVRHRSTGDRRRGELLEPAQRVKDDVRGQAHGCHHHHGQLVLGVHHRAHDDDEAVEESGERRQNQQVVLSLAAEVVLVEPLQRLGRKGEAHGAGQAAAAAGLDHGHLPRTALLPGILPGEVHRLLRVRVVDPVHRHDGEVNPPDACNTGLVVPKRTG